MTLFTKILIGVLALCCVLNAIAINWELGFFHEDNTISLFGASASIVGALLILVLNAWGKVKG